MTLKRYYENAADAERDALKSWRDRNAKARARIDAARDPSVLLIRRVRAYEQNMAGADQRARQDYRALHMPVASNVPAAVHPQVAAKLADLMRDAGLADRDLSRPLIEDGETEEAMVSRYRADAQAEHEAAVAALARNERENAEAEVAAAQARLTDVVATYGDAVELLPAEAPVAAEPPRRGRPPKRLNVQDLSQVLSADD